MIFGLSGGMGQLTGCAHEAATSTPPMASRSACLVYLLISRKVKEAEQALLRYAAIVESSDDGISSVNLDGITVT